MAFRLNSSDIDTKIWVNDNLVSGGKTLAQILNQEGQKTLFIISNPKLTQPMEVVVEGTGSSPIVKVIPAGFTTGLATNTYSTATHELMRLAVNNGHLDIANAGTAKDDIVIASIELANSIATQARTGTLGDEELRQIVHARLSFARVQEGAAMSAYSNLEHLKSQIAKTSLSRKLNLLNRESFIMQPEQTKISVGLGKIKDREVLNDFLMSVYEFQGKKVGHTTIDDIKKIAHGVMGEYIDANFDNLVGTTLSSDARQIIMDNIADADYLFRHFYGQSSFAESDYVSRIDKRFRHLKQAAIKKERSGLINETFSYISEKINTLLEDPLNFDVNLVTAKSGAKSLNIKPKKEVLTKFFDDLSVGMPNEYLFGNKRSREALYHKVRKLKIKNEIIDKIAQYYENQGKFDTHRSWTEQVGMKLELIRRIDEDGNEVTESYVNKPIMETKYEHIKWSRKQSYSHVGPIAEGDLLHETTLEELKEAREDYNREWEERLKGIARTKAARGKKVHIPKEKKGHAKGTKTGRKIGRQTGGKHGTIVVNYDVDLTFNKKIFAEILESRYPTTRHIPVKKTYKEFYKGELRLVDELRKLKFADMKERFPEHDLTIFAFTHIGDPHIGDQIIKLAEDEFGNNEDQLAKAATRRLSDLSNAYLRFNKGSGPGGRIDSFLSTLLPTKILPRGYVPFQGLSDIISILENPDYLKSNPIMRVIDTEGWQSDNISLTTEVGSVNVANMAANQTAVDGTWLALSSHKRVWNAKDKRFVVTGAVDKKTQNYLEENLLKMFHKIRQNVLAGDDPTGQADALLFEFHKLLFGTGENESAVMKKNKIINFIADYSDMPPDAVGDFMLSQYEKTLEHKYKRGMADPQMSKYYSKMKFVGLEGMATDIERLTKNSLIFTHGTIDPIALQEVMRATGGPEISTKFIDVIPLIHAAQNYAQKNPEAFAKVMSSAENLEHLMGRFVPNVDMGALMQHTGMFDSEQTGNVMLTILNMALDPNSPESKEFQAAIKSQDNGRVFNSFMSITKEFQREAVSHNKTIASFLPEGWESMTEGAQKQYLTTNGMEFYGVTSKTVTQTMLDTLVSQGVEIDSGASTSFDEPRRYKVPGGLGRRFNEERIIGANQAVKMSLRIAEDTVSGVLSMPSGARYNITGPVRSMENVINTLGLQSHSSGTRNYFTKILDRQRRVLGNIMGTFNVDPSEVSYALSNTVNNLRVVSQHLNDDRISETINGISKIMSTEALHADFDTTGTIGKRVMENLFDLQRLMGDYGAVGDNESIATALVWGAEYGKNIGQVEDMFVGMNILHEMTRSTYSTDAAILANWDDKLFDWTRGVLEKVGIVNYGQLQPNTVLDHAVMRIGTTDSSVILSMNSTRLHSDMKRIANRASEGMKEHMGAMTYLADQFLENNPLSGVSDISKIEKPVLVQISNDISEGILKEIMTSPVSFRNKYAADLRESYISVGRGGVGVAEEIMNQIARGDIDNVELNRWKRLARGQSSTLTQTMMDYGATEARNMLEAAAESGDTRHAFMAANTAKALSDMGMTIVDPIENMLFPKVLRDIQTKLTPASIGKGAVAAGLAVSALAATFGLKRPPITSLEDIPPDETFELNELEGRAQNVEPMVIGAENDEYEGYSVRVRAKARSGKYNPSSLASQLKLAGFGHDPSTSSIQFSRMRISEEEISRILGSQLLGEEQEQ